jgi:hypothetical protein
MKRIRSIVLVLFVVIALGSISVSYACDHEAEFVENESE